MNKYYLISFGIAVLVIAGLLYFSSGDVNVGVYGGPNTNTSSTIGLATTSVIATNENLEYFKAFATGGEIFCASGADAVLNEGMRIAASSSNLGSTLELKAPSRALQQGLNCIATATSTLSIYKYGF